MNISAMNLNHNDPMPSLGAKVERPKPPTEAEKRKAALTDFEGCHNKMPDGSMWEDVAAGAGYVAFDYGCSDHTAGDLLIWRGGKLETYWSARHDDFNNFDISAEALEAVKASTAERIRAAVAVQAAANARAFNFATFQFNPPSPETMQQIAMVQQMQKAAQELTGLDGIKIASTGEVMKTRPEPPWARAKASAGMP